jgi:hypothetical protein
MFKVGIVLAMAAGKQGNRKATVISRVKPSASAVFFLLFVEFFVVFCFNILFFLLFYVTAFS